MKKEIDINDLSEEELRDYLAANSDEDLTADSNTNAENNIKRPEIREEEIRKSDLDNKKEENPNLKINDKNSREFRKKMRKHKKEIKKNPTSLVRYDVDPNFGLPNDIVEERYLEELVNVSHRKKTRSVGKIIFHNCFSFFNILIYSLTAILIILAVIYKRWEPITDLSFFVIVSANIIIGIIQEIRAKKMIESLSLMNDTTAIVLRNGVKKAISISDVVLDDLLVLSIGNQICADSIVVDGQIEVNESLLTGESDSIIKRPGDQLYSGSFVVSGNCSARVDKIGADNYIEKLASQAKVHKKPNSDLLKTLNRIIMFMFFPVIFIGGFLFLRMYLNTDISLFDNVRKTAGAMVGMIPSGLFLMSSVALYVGVIRLGQRNVLVQELYCIEMLARVNCICLDKTGTITDGTMVVKNVIDYDQVSGLATKNIISALLNALPDRNMTSDALIDKFGLGRIMKYKATIPFSSERKYQAVTFDNYGTFILGAPEFVLKEEFYKISKDVDKYSNLGYRVLCLAYKNGEIIDNELPKGETTVLSVILIEDRIRPDAIDTIKYFKESGVEVRVISGDNPITVSKISQRAGVPNADNYISLDGMTDDEVVRIATKYTIFGRVNPNQKKLLVQSLKKSGKTVAMTGDGVNDILALREADCSIALGSGSDATRSCSHLVLLDSNFGSMPSVVSEGRRVINNVTSVASLFLTKTIFSLLLGVLAILIGTYPITPKQLILIEAFAIGIPSIFLVNEPNNSPVTGSFLFNVLKKALPGALVIVILSLMIFALRDSLHLDNKSLTTIIVITATHTSLMVLFKACRPFNTLRRIICTFSYTVCVLAVFLVPQFLEFKPLTVINEYYSSTETFLYANKYPEVAISSSNFYVIDGKISDIRTYSNNRTLSRYDDSSVFTYAIDGVNSGVSINIPDVSYDKNGNIFAGGYEINNLKYSDDLAKKLIVDEYGFVYYESYSNPITITLKKTDPFYNYYVEYGNYDKTAATRIYNILPNVEIENDRYIITGPDVIEETDGGYYKASGELSRLFASGDVDVTIDPDSLELLIDGEPIKKEINGNPTDETYKVSLPVISTEGNRRNNAGYKEYKVFFSGLKATNIFKVYGLRENVSEDLGLTKDSYSYTITKNENGESYKYIYIEYYDKIFKILASEDLFDHSEDLEDYLIEDFVFDDFANSDYRNYLDKDGNQIDINNQAYPLGFNVAVDKQVYSLQQGDNAVETGISLNNSRFSPSIIVSDNSHFVIDGYYTDYEYSVGATVVETFYKNERDEYCLQIGNYKTNYELNVVETTGGIVRELNLTNKILLLMLCLLASPLMRLLQYAFPWLNKNFKSLGKLLNKW